MFDLSKRYYSAADEITTTFKQNFIAFITFFTSIFVLQTISTGKISNIFTSDISLISYALLLISAIYLVATFINFIIKRSRIDRDYFNLKNKYSDVLEIQDVERIFGFDEDHMKLKRNLMIQAILLSLSWLLSLVVFSVAIFLLTGEGKATDSPNKHSLSDSRISSIIAASIDVEKECEDNKDTLDLASKHIDENRPKPAAPPEGSVGLPKAPVKPTKSKGVTSVRQQAG